MRFVRANKAYSIPILSEILGRDPELVSRLCDQLAFTYSDASQFEAGRMKGLARALRDQFGLEESAITGLYTEELLPVQ